jgi:3-hydroxymyristoyl/3-hydroxydecanoyl-(acyl carrier protein) dehydratase
MQFAVSADHPSLPGHFPGHPVVPGVVVLNHVFELLQQSVGAERIVGIKRLKFLQQVLPGQSLRLECGAQQSGKIVFRCWLGESLAVDGQALLKS